jgi:benzoate-CoA ligase
MAGFCEIDRSVSPAAIRIPRDFNAAHDLIGRNLAAGRAEKAAIRDETGVHSYGDLAARANRAGNALCALGLAMEQRVLMIILDSVDFASVFLGAIKAGGVAVPVNTLLTAADYAYMLRDSRARIAVVSAALWDKVAPALADQPFLDHIVIAGGDAPGTKSLDALLDSASDALDPAPTTCDDVAFWLYTSGSTGQPKAAVHIQSDIVHTAELYAVGVLGIGEADTVFSAAKLFFAYGLGNALTFPLHVGATAVLMAERPTPDSIVARLRAERPSIFYGVPTLYAALLARDDLPAGGEIGLRRCVSAGEALPAELGRRWSARVGVDILDGIGSTEMLHIFISLAPGDVKYGTTGKPVPGYAARIVDETGAEAARGAVGDLLVSGPSAAIQYWNNREKSAATFEGRWTRTGDKYSRDEDGYYVYAGRSDDMLKVGGIYVSPFEVEGALIGHPAVLEAAVVGRKDENGLVKPKAVVVPQAGVAADDALAEALKDHVKASLAPFKYPRWIEFAESLPKTATGKIQRFKLRDDA